MSDDCEAQLAQTQAQLARAEAVVNDLDHFKSDFIAHISHELRSPLAAVTGGLELLLADPEDLSPRALEILNLVQARTRRLNRLVTNVLHLAALDAGQMPLTLQPAALVNLLADLAFEWPAAAHTRLHLAVPVDLPLMRADPDALTSILFHLIDNALKYAPTGPIHLTAEGVADQVRVHVCDSGPGLPPAARERAFARFERLDLPSDAPQGYGPGLYLARRLLRAMQGEMVVAESANGGACFSFWLPVVEDSELYGE